MTHNLGTAHKSIISVLLVEDNPADIHLIRLGFEKLPADYRIKVFHNASKALVYLTSAGQDELPNIIVLDMNLPGKNGKELAREIRDIPSLRHIPVLMFSTHDCSQDRDASSDPFIDAFFVKSFNVDEYHKAIADMSQYYHGLGK